MSSKSKRKQLAKASSPGLPGGMAAAIRWPVHDIAVSENWQDEAALVTLLVARQSPLGKIAAAVFLLDMGCLGVKSATIRSFPTYGDYHQQVRLKFMDAQSFVAINLDMAAKILYAGHAYAESLGFKPDPVFHQAVYLLSGANPDSCPIPVPVGGPEGKPLFVAGPFDDARRIIDHLTRQVGEGNFHYIAPIGMDALMDEE